MIPGKYIKDPMMTSKKWLNILILISTNQVIDPNHEILPFSENSEEIMKLPKNSFLAIQVLQERIILVIVPNKNMNLESPRESLIRGRGTKVKQVKKHPFDTLFHRDLIQITMSAIFAAFDVIGRFSNYSC